MRTEWRTLLGLLAVACVTREPAVGSSVDDRARGIERPQASAQRAFTRADAEAALCSLYAERDVDCDRRITVLDERLRCGKDECATSQLVRFGRSSVRVTSVYQAAQVATELAEGLLGQSAQTESLSEAVLLDPASYLRGRIQNRYWQGLTRVIAPSGGELLRVLRDQKQGAVLDGGPNWCAGQRSRCNESSLKPEDALVVATHPTRERLFLYTPESDPTAREIYRAAENVGTTSSDVDLHVGVVPMRVTRAWVDELTRRKAHGMLTLAYDALRRPLPFVVPGGRFNELYGWDTYFIARGLLRSASDATSVASRQHFVEMAKSLVDHQAYQIRYYGKILNANRTYYLLRSQPPFFAALLGELDPIVGDRGWTQAHLKAAQLEYNDVWASKPRRTQLCEGDVCLARYAGEASGPPPEVEPGHFAAAYQAHAISHQHCSPPGESDGERNAFLECVERMVNAYQKGAPDVELDVLFEHDACVRESGHDTTFRWFVDGWERCADFVTVDLNALLFRYELEVSRLLAKGGDPQARSWCERAKARSRLMQQYSWNEDKGLFVDYDFVRKRQSSYISATTLYPLWASVPNQCGASLVTPRQAQRLVANALALLEAPGGLLATATSALSAVSVPQTLVRTSDGIVARSEPRQWEAPNGWAPHQMLAWEGLRQHGFDPIAERLAYRWLHMVTSNAAQYHGTVPEKFDVVARSHRVFAEYGNVNTNFAYIAREGFGWMNASVLVGLQVLSKRGSDALQRLEPAPAVQDSNP